MIFKVGIVNDGELALRILQRGADGAAFALVLFVTNEDPLHSSTTLVSGKRFLKFLEDGGGLIRGTVVYDNDLDPLQQRGLRQDLQSLEAGRYQMALVVDGYQHRKTCHLGSLTIRFVGISSLHSGYSPQFLPAITTRLPLPGDCPAPYSTLQFFSDTTTGAAARESYSHRPCPGVELSHPLW